MRLFVIQRYTCCKVWFGGLDLWNLLLSHTSSISNPGLPLIIIALLSDKHCITQSSPPRVISAHNLTTSALGIFSLLHCSSFDWDCIVLADAFSNQPTRRCPSLLICFLAAAVPLCCTTLLYQEKEVGLQHNWSRSRRPDAFSPCGSSYTALLLFQNYTDCTEPTDCRASNICLPNNWSRRLRPVHFHHVLPYIALCA